MSTIFIPTYWVCCQNNEGNVYDVQTTYTFFFSWWNARHQKGMRSYKSWIGGYRSVFVQITGSNACTTPPMNNEHVTLKNVWSLRTKVTRQVVATLGPKKKKSAKRICNGKIKSDNRARNPHDVSSAVLKETLLTIYPHGHPRVIWECRLGVGLRGSRRLIWGWKGSCSNALKGVFSRAGSHLGPI